MAMTTDGAPQPRCLLLTGTVGAGKTTTAYAVGDLLRERGVPHAVIDLDEFHRLWPAPAGDRFNQQVELANVRAVAANYREAGATHLVLAGVVVEDRGRYEAALGEPVLLCRLRTRLDRVEARLTARHAPGDERDWHVGRAPELETILDEADTADLTIEVRADDPGQVAARVLAATAWPD